MFSAAFFCISKARPKEMWYKLFACLYEAKISAYDQKNALQLGYHFCNVGREVPNPNGEGVMYLVSIHWPSTPFPSKLFDHEKVAQSFIKLWKPKVVKKYVSALNESESKPSEKQG